MRALLLAASFAALAGGAEPRTWYIAPSGLDANPGNTSAAPFRSFRRAFDKMSAGDELVLLDGVYSERVGTGHIGMEGAVPGLSTQVPSGLDAARPTVVRAARPGKVVVDGRLFIGRSSRKDRFIRIQGVTFKGGGHLYNTSHVTVKDCGFHGSFGIGTNDHHQGNEHNLVEDAWIWAAGERAIAFNYRSHLNVWRRVVVRGDGCGTPACRTSPSIGITVYDSSDVSMQNVIVVDRILAKGDVPYSDFAIAQHTPDPRYYFGRNEWLGTISLDAPDSGYYMEPDQGATLDPTIRISNAVSWGAKGAGLNLARAGTNNVVENVTIGDSALDGIRIASELTSGTLRNVISVGAGRFGINSRYPPSYASVHGARAASFNQAACTVACYAMKDPRADGAVPSLRHVVRVEPGSFLKGRGHGGMDIGANVVFRYGRDGSRHGEPGFNALTSTPLWPWPNEARLKAEMCAGVDRGFCRAQSLTRYIWEYLGNAMPENPYQARH